MVFAFWKISLPVGLLFWTLKEYGFFPYKIAIDINFTFYASLTKSIIEIPRTLFSLECYELHTWHDFTSHISNSNSIRICVASEVNRSVIASLDATITMENVASYHEVRARLIEQSVESLLHAMQCQDSNCNTRSCARKKVFLAHTKTCKRQLVGGCIPCMQVFKLFCYNLKICQIEKWTSPFGSKLECDIRIISET